MRDSTLAVELRKSREREALLNEQFRFLETRNRATEAVLLASSLWSRLLFLWEPELLKRAVDAVQWNLLHESRPAVRPPTASQVAAAEATRG